MITDRRRIVVLGGTGFIGQHVAAEFGQAGYEVSRFGSRDLDLTAASAAEAVAQAIGPEDLVFFAAVIPPRLGRDRATMLRNVAMGTAVSEAVERRGGGGFVYMSTDNVYPLSEERLHEGTRLDPVDLYGLGHLVRERMLEDACASRGVPCLVLRTGPVYGPGSRTDSYGPSRFLRTAADGGRVTLFGQGEEIRHHLYAPDLARAVRFLVARRVTGVIHVAPAAGASFRQVAELVRDLVGPHVRIEERPRRVALRHRIHVPERLRSLLPEFACTPLRTGLARTLAATAAARG